MRDKKIIQELIRCDTYVSVAYLSNLLNVSSRTIMNDIKYLILDGTRYGYQIQLLRGKGYYLEVKDEAIFSKYVATLNAQEIGYEKERVPKIISLLLLQNDYITQDMIADLFGVSKSVVKTDMMKVTEILSQKGMKLDRKAHYGIKLETDNFARKEYILELYENGDDLILKKMNEVAGEEFLNVEKLLITLLKEFDLNTNYIEMKKIDTFIKICIYSNLYKLNCGVETLGEKDIYFQIAERFRDLIETQYQTCLGESELYDLALYIKQKTRRKLAEIQHADGLEERVETFLKVCDKRYHTNFNEDLEFKQSLLFHVSLLLDRLHQSISFSNPLVNEISVKYPVNFNIAIQFAQELEKAYDVAITQDEIGFIATHFSAHTEREVRNMLGAFNRIAIVCSTGGGSSFLIKLKLTSLFSNSDIQTFSLMQESELMAYHPDVIFTITDLHNSYNVPIIKIKELLDDNDILKIKSMFNLGQVNMMQDTSAIVSLMRKDCFFIFEDTMDYHEILTKMAKNVEDLGLVSNDYLDNLLLRESYVSTIYNNGIAIPHPLNICAKQNVISIGIVKSKNKGPKSVKVVFLVSLLIDHMKLHEELARILFEVMEREESVQYLNEAVSFEDFIIRMNSLKL